MRVGALGPDGNGSVVTAEGGEITKNAWEVKRQNEQKWRPRNQQRPEIYISEKIRVCRCVFAGGLRPAMHTRRDYFLSSVNAKKTKAPVRVGAPGPDGNGSVASSEGGENTKNFWEAKRRNEQKTAIR